MSLQSGKMQTIRVSQSTSGGTLQQNRFKAESPKIPGVGELQPKTPGLSSMHLAAIAVVVLLTASLTMYWIASRKRAANVRASAPAELQLPTETPSPAVAPATQANKDQVNCHRYRNVQSLVFQGICVSRCIFRPDQRSHAGAFA